MSTGHHPDLERYLDRALDLRTQADVEAHLSTCVECRTRVEEWHRLAGSITTWADSRFARNFNPSNAARLTQRLEHESARTRWGLPRLALALMALAVAGAAVTLWRSKGPDAEPPALVWVLEEAQPSQKSRPAQAALEAGGEHVLARLGKDRVALARHSRARLTKADSKRTVVALEAGSAAFEVEHRVAGATFEIDAGDVVIRVIGTRFSVSRASDGTVRVTVQRGKVSVEAPGVSELLGPGQSLQHNAQGGRIEALAAEDLALFALLDPQDEAVASDNVDAGVTPTEPDAVAELDDWEPELPKPLAPHARPVPRTARHDLQAWRQMVLDGRFTQAQSALQAHLRKSPKDVRARALLGDCQRKSGDWAAAVSTYRRVIAQGNAASANRARYLAASILQDQLAQPAAAVPLFQQYLREGARLRPLEAAATVRLARALLALGRGVEARPLLERVIRDHGGEPVADEARALLGH